MWQSIPQVIHRIVTNIILIYNYLKNINWNTENIRKMDIWHLWITMLPFLRNLLYSCWEGFDWLIHLSSLLPPCLLCSYPPCPLMMMVLWLTNLPAFNVALSFQTQNKRWRGTFTWGLNSVSHDSRGTVTESQILHSSWFHLLLVYL